MSIENLSAETRLKNRILEQILKDYKKRFKSIEMELDIAKQKISNLQDYKENTRLLISEVGKLRGEIKGWNKRLGRLYKHLEKEAFKDKFLIEDLIY